MFKKKQPIPNQKNKLYRIIPARTKRQKKYLTFELLGESLFPGVVIQVLKIKMNPGENPEEIPSLKCQVDYKIKKVPSGKYQNMPEEMRVVFQEMVGKVLGDVLVDDVQSMKKLNTTTPTEQKNS